MRRTSGPSAPPSSQHNFERKPRVRTPKKAPLRLAAVATAGVLALGLGLSACGDDDDADASEGGGAKTADIRVWLNGTDTPDAAREWLKTTFEDEHPGSTLTIEQQEWEGLVEKLTTSGTLVCILKASS